MKGSYNFFMLEIWERNWLEIEDLKKRWYLFINEAFVLYRGKTRLTVADFAREIGVSQPLMSQWMAKNGKIPRNQESINKLVKYFGDGIYSVLGYPEPSDPIDGLPLPLQSVARELREKVAEYGVSGDSPEAETLLDEIMQKHGYSKIETTSPDGDK